MGYYLTDEDLEVLMRDFPNVSPRHFVGFDLALSTIKEKFKVEVDEKLLMKLLVKDRTGKVEEIISNAWREDEETSYLEWDTRLVKALAQAISSGEVFKKELKGCVK